MINMHKAKIEEYLAEGKIAGAIELLLEVVPESHAQVAIGLSARNELLERQKMQGVLSHAELMLEYNKIITAVLDIISREDIFSSRPTSDLAVKDTERTTHGIQVSGSDNFILTNVSSSHINVTLDKK